MSKKHFTVVARAESGAYFPPDGSFTINATQTEFGALKITYRTRRVQYKNFDKPVPKGLFVEVSGIVDDLDLALTGFTNEANKFIPFITIIVNSPTMNFSPELGFDTTPGLIEHEFFQQKLKEEDILPFSRREVSNDILVELMTCYVGHKDSERLHRALSHYHRALQEWGPGAEIVVANHLWIAMECLTAVAMRFNYPDMSREQVSGILSVDIRALDAEIKKRFLFNGNLNLYKVAKDASDGLEHGYEPLPSIHKAAVNIHEDLAGLVRKKILELSGLSEESVSQLTQLPTSDVLHLQTASYLRGLIVGSAEILKGLAKSGEEYPRLIWTTEVSVVKTEAGSQDVNLRDSFTGCFADGVTFKPSSLEVWGSKGRSALNADVSTIDILAEADVDVKTKGYTGIKLNAPESVEFSGAIGRFLINFGFLEFMAYEIIRLISREEIYENYLGRSFGNRLTHIKNCIYQMNFSDEQKRIFEETIESARVMADARAWISHNPICFGDGVDEGGNKIKYIKIMKMNAPRNAVPGMDIVQLNRGVDLVHGLANDFAAMYQTVVSHCAANESNTKTSP